GIDGIVEGIDGIGQGIAGMESGIAEMDAAKAELQAGIDGVSTAIAGMEAGLAAQDELISALDMIASGDIAGGMSKLKSMDSSSLPEGMSMDMETLPQQLETLKAAREQLAQKLETTKAQRSQMQSALAEISAGQNELRSSAQSAKDQQTLMIRARELMAEIRDEMPEIFDRTEANYLDAIDSSSEEIENVFQSTVNTGYRNMYLFLVAVNLAGLLLLAFYKEDRKKAASKEAA
ncbi:MAG: hypothetical protein Q4A83_04745, partial [Bacillota bacterium]|nr:hypothetical protein [Bacillota bacterium]